MLDFLLSAPAHGQAFRISDQSASGAGQGNAFTAQADDPSAIHYNPAGMTQLPGLQLSGGTNLASIHTTFTNAEGVTVHGGPADAVANPPPTNFYLTASLKGRGLPALDKLTVGLGVTSPFGLQVSYPLSGPLATVTTYAALPLFDIKPTVAFKVNDVISVGAGIDIYTFSSAVGDGHAELKRLAGPELAPLGIPQGTGLEVNGTDTAVGFNAGLLVTPLRNASGPILNLGLVYRSQVTLDLEGDFLANGVRVAGDSIRLELPWILSGGVAVWPFQDVEREWKIEVDVDYVDWTSFKNSNVKLSNGVTIPFPRNWRAVYVVRIGTEYKWRRVAPLPGWELAIRAGYDHSQTPVPEETFGPDVPDADLNTFSVGLGVVCRGPGKFLGFIPCGSEGSSWWAPKAIGLDLAYQRVIYDSRRISNNIDPRVIGQWETSGDLGLISFRASF